MESSSGIFGGDTTLNGETSSVNVFLCETELLESNTSGDLNLSSDNVDTGDFLCEQPSASVSKTPGKMTWSTVT